MLAQNKQTDNAILDKKECKGKGIILLINYIFQNSVIDAKAEWIPTYLYIFNGILLDFTHYRRYSTIVVLYRSEFLT